MSNYSGKEKISITSGGSFRNYRITLGFEALYLEIKEMVLARRICH